MKFSFAATGAAFATVVLAAPVAIDIPTLSVPSISIPSVSLPTAAIASALPSTGIDLSSLSDLSSLGSLSGLEGLLNITTSLTQLGELLTSGAVPNATVVAPIVEQFFSSTTITLNSIDLSIFSTDTTQVDAASSALSTLLGTTQSYLDEYADAAAEGLGNEQLTDFVTELESIFGMFTAGLQDLLSTNLFRIGVALVLNDLPDFITQFTSVFLPL